MNSTATRFLLESIAGGSKSLGTPTIVKDMIRIGEYNAQNPVHIQLASKSRQAHALARNGASDNMIEKEIDRLVAAIHDLSDAEFEKIKTT
jgi:hypothetical protein